MKNLEFNSSLVEGYFQLLKNLSKEAKKELIEKLSKIFLDPKKKKQKELELFGALESIKSADEIIKEINESRNISREIEEL